MGQITYDEKKSFILVIDCISYHILMKVINNHFLIQQLQQGKPPRHPNVPVNDVTNKIGPEIQARIRELGAVRPGSGKEEMNILSKILVTLLCSCKTTSASLELKKIIKQFKDAAREASDEVGEGPIDLEKISKSCSRTSSR